MLQFKFIKEGEDKELNELLDNSIIAQGMPIVRVGGGIMFPYEDGRYLTITQQIITLQDLANKAKQSAELLVVDQNMFLKQIKNIEQQITDLNKMITEDPGKESYDSNKEIKDKIKVLENVLENKKGSIKANQVQITEYYDTMNGYNEAIKHIEETKK